MLTLKLDTVWRAASEPERLKALVWAEMALANLVHYPMARRLHYRDDVEMLAAEFIAFKAERALTEAHEN